MQLISPPVALKCIKVCKEQQVEDDEKLGIMPARTNYYGLAVPVAEV
jgi:hypothetical protein